MSSIHTFQYNNTPLFETNTHKFLGIRRLFSHPINRTVGSNPNLARNVCVFSHIIYKLNYKLYFNQSLSEIKFKNRFSAFQKCFITQQDNDKRFDPQVNFQVIPEWICETSACKTLQRILDLPHPNDFPHLVTDLTYLTETKKFMDYVLVFVDEAVQMGDSKLVKLLLVYCEKYESLSIMRPVYRKIQTYAIRNNDLKVCIFYLICLF